ncbi:hypothetical protein [Sphingomonas aracearum]|uniref:Uncharacterized protein n=1 Tax=Sphingomonas aracearum TaxID=2283317 RepID=A0A369VYU9_9SPHN|nr:hypothetical protein [Sphingomonas aracearum]RDE06232.1 hypothetical protein DVW87_00385 [Sphingomonas aracearum]
MYRSEIVGSAKAATEKLDRTLVLDPNTYWPDAMTCPDWPVVGPNQGYDGQRGKEGAENRLEAIGRYLNRGDGKLRRPTEEERADEFARTFRRLGPSFDALQPLGMMAEADATLMKEACHIRGYLRKLEAKAERDARAAVERKQAEARRVLDEYRTTVPGYVEEIESLAEAVARHNQRLEDEKAVRRTQMLRDHAETLHTAAVSAAHALGLSVPDAPAILR